MITHNPFQQPTDKLVLAQKSSMKPLETDRAEFLQARDIFYQLTNSALKHRLHGKWKLKM